MAIGNLQGRAWTSARSPEAQGECDRCRFWYPLSALQRQFQWRGAALADTGYLVCRRCLDVPQEQNRVLILPGDPIPRVNPRPSPDVTGYATAGSVAVPTNPGNLGFSQYVINAPTDPALYPNPMTGYPDAASSALGKAAALAAVASVSGIPTPAQIIDASTTIAKQNISRVILPAQTAREWVCLYNPSVAPVQVALASVAYWGVLTNLPLGPGQALFWAEAQGLGMPYLGAISVIGQIPGVPIWAWQSPSPGVILTDEFGVPITDEFGNWIPLV